MIENILEMKHISKRFPGVQALKDVDFELIRGEIHALVGQNGAGKSTLLKILAGIYQVESGEIIIAGENATRWRPNEVLDHGVSFIYQELNLIPDLSVAQNLLLKREPINRLGLIDWGEVGRRAKAALLRIGMDNVDVNLPLQSISVAHQQMVAIARALDQDPKLLVLDEPTSRLSKEEIERLFTVLDQLAKKGISIIYVSHRLEEVYRISQRVTVLRDGARIGTHETAKLTPQDLIQEMVGERVREVKNASAPEPGSPVCLQVRGLCGPKVNEVDFDLKKGELLGIVGAVGAGKTEMLRLLFNIDRRTKGSVLVNGKDVDNLSTGSAIGSGFALAPEDRKKQGLLLDSSLFQNITLVNLKPYTWGGCLVSQAKEKSHASQMIQSLRIATPSPVQKARLLSGGNQQKVVLAKWLSTEAQVFLFDEPTVGVDVMGKTEIYDLMRQLTGQGKGVVLVTSDPEEAWQVCSRLLVMFEGRITAEFDPTKASLDQVMVEVMGGKE